MHLIFFDEVKPQKDYPHYHIGAICIEEKSLKEIEGLINDISQEVFDDIVLKTETEFHAVNIFHRKNQFKEMHEVQKRYSVLVSLLEVLSKPEVELIEIQINNSKLYNADNAADYAFMFLCERTNSLMKAKGSLGMLIGDRDNDSTTHRFSVALSQYRCTGTQFQYKEEITNLFESVHFTPSHLSRFLQLADIYAWICQFYNRHRNNFSKHQQFLDLIKAKNINLFPAKYKKWPS